MATYRETAKVHLGAKFTWAQLEEVSIPNTLENIPYADKNQNESMFPDLDKEIMPEVGDEYINTLVMLLHESQMMRSAVKAPKLDLDGNPIGH